MNFIGNFFRFRVSFNFHDQDVSVVKQWKASRSSLLQRKHRYGERGDLTAEVDDIQHRVKGYAS